MAVYVFAVLVDMPNPSPALISRVRDQLELTITTSQLPVRFMEVKSAPARIRPRQNDHE
jgi:hypothetical protein